MLPDRRIARILAQSRFDPGADRAVLRMPPPFQSGVPARRAQIHRPSELPPPDVPSHRLQVLCWRPPLLFSTGGAAIKACTLSSWQVACFRSGIAAVAMLLLLPGARRGWSLRALPVGRRLRRHHGLLTCSATS